MIFQWFEGTVRDLFIAMDAIQTFIAFQISVFFLFRAFKSKRASKINLGWFIVFLCLGIMSLLSIFRVYYLSESILSEFEKIFNVITYIPAAAIVFMLEMFYQQFKKTKYIITLSGVIILVISLLIAPEFTSTFVSFYFILLFFFTISFFYKLIKISSGTVKMNIIIFTFSFYALMVGNIMAYPGRYETWVITSEELILLVFIGKSIQTSSIMIIAAVLFKLPIFFEVNWKENLIRIYIIIRGAGITFYHKNFKEESMDEDNAPEMDEELVGGGMVGIATMLKEISQSKEDLKIIDHGDQKIVLDYSEYFFIALNVKTEMRIYLDKLDQLRKFIEAYHNEFLEDWNGDIDVFRSLGNKVNEIFQ